MSPQLAYAIDAARDLAWRPHANLRPMHHRDRRDSHERLVEALGHLTVVDSVAGPIQRIRLVAAMRRVAACTFSSRFGPPYYDRKQRLAELRGCLVAYDQAVAA